jgi:hypothetical protein
VIIPKLEYNKWISHACEQKKNKTNFYDFRLYIYCHNTFVPKQTKKSFPGSFKTRHISNQPKTQLGLIEMYVFH